VTDAILSSPRWRRRKHDRPAEIIAAALAVFAEKGFAAAKLDDIATRAGLSKGALYLYFADKQDLFRAVVAEAVAPNFEAVRAAAESHRGPFADLIRALLPMVAGFARQAPIGGVLKMVIGESRNFPELARVWHDALVANALALVSGRIAAAQARGEVKPGDPRAYALGLISPLVLGIIWRETFAPIGAPDFDLDALVRQHVETVLSGMLTAKEAA
jgi:AcrR family transcriptional regulator